MSGTNLTQAEWSVMEALWERGALTGREAAELLSGSCGWSRRDIGACGGDREVMETIDETMWTCGVSQRSFRGGAPDGRSAGAGRQAADGYNVMQTPSSGGV